MKPAAITGDASLRKTLLLRVNEETAAVSLTLLIFYTHNNGKVILLFNLFFQWQNVHHPNVILYRI